VKRLHRCDECGGTELSIRGFQQMNTGAFADTGDKPYCEDCDAVVTTTYDRAPIREGFVLKHPEDFMGFYAGLDQRGCPMFCTIRAGIKIFPTLQEVMHLSACAGLKYCTIKVSETLKTHCK
jgi:hypothetical protein